MKGGEIVKVEFDYSKLRGKIREYGRQDEFAEALEISTTTLSERLNNKSEFTQKEINKACEILKISNVSLVTAIGSFALALLILDT